MVSFTTDAFPKITRTTGALKRNVHEQMSKAMYDIVPHTGNPDVKLAPFSSSILYKIWLSH